MTCRIVTLSNAISTRADDYARWYVDQHLGDVLNVPGVLGGQFFQAAAEASRWRHLAVYEIEDGGAPDVIAELGRRRGSSDMPITDAMDTDSLVFIIAKPLGGWRTAGAASAGDETAAQCRLIALSNAVAGREQDFEQWYDEQHLPDVLRIPGFVGAQRFEIQPSGRGTPPAWSRLAIYAAASEDPGVLLAEIGKRAGTAEMPITDALDRTSGFTGLFTALTPHRSA